MQDRIKNAFLIFSSIFLSVVIVEITSFVTRKIIVKNKPIFFEGEKSNISYENLDLSRQIEIIKTKTIKELKRIYDSKWMESYN